MPLHTDFDHRNSYPHCKMALGIEDSNIPIVNSNQPSQTSCSVSTSANSASFPSSNYVQLSQPYQSHSQLLETRFPSVSPIKSEMSNVETRINTFSPRPGATFMCELFRSNIKDLSEAGFYYLGVGDYVACWYCGGGLKKMA